MDLRMIDPTGEGTSFPSPYPADAGRTSYNGDSNCKSCGLILNPVQSLNSDLCPSCSRRTAINRVKNKMV
jgi:predicted RNA-binding Zn-ribbon protein involved in translation (DUF1610 family)